MPPAAREALMAIEKFNLEAPAGRKYELSMAYRAVLTSEHYHTVALAELFGSERALAHATFVVSTISAVNPDFFNPASTDFEVERPSLAHAASSSATAARSTA